MRQFGKALAVALLLTTVWSSSVRAANQWFTADVHGTGPSSGGLFYVLLTDTAASPRFTSKWFTFSANVQKEMLATALTAIAASKKVWIFTDPEAPGIPTVVILYVRELQS